MLDDVKPGGKPHPLVGGMPVTLMDPSAFRSLRMARLEDEAVWTRDWICIGTEHDVPDAGDLLPFTAGDHAIHVQRLVDGGITGRFNKAQHGGCRVVPVQCRQGTKTPCSFTSCGHSRDRMTIKASELGDATPEMHQYLGLRPERLLPVRVAQVGPLLFANLDPQGASIDESARELCAALPALSQRDLTRGYVEWLEFDCNWKLAGQHLVAADGMPSPPGVSLLVAETTLKDLPAAAFWLFPNLLVLTALHEMCVVVLQPVSLTRTLLRISVLVDRGATPLNWSALVRQRAAAAVAAQMRMNCNGPADGALRGLDDFDVTDEWLHGLLTSRFASTRLDATPFATMT